MRSIRIRLALLFSAITLTAIAGIYLYVAPTLESSLRNAKLHSLAGGANTYSSRLVLAIGTNVDQTGVNQAVREAADRAGARVTLLGVSRGTQGLQTYPISDSTAATNFAGADFVVALEAARTGHRQTGTEPTNEGRLAEAARPLYFNGRVARVVVYSAPLGEVSRNVALIRRRIAVAGVFALLFAVLAGYLVARAVTAEFTPALAQHDSKLELRLADDPIRTVCDRERVAQVVRILLDNALTHTPAGTDIFVSARRENDHVRLAVRDHGLGIHTKAMPRIFEPFFTSDDAQGSGLGLAIAHELAERMRGRLEVESRPGRTTFTLELPS